MVSLERLEVMVFRVPTDAPEADGTFSWNATTAVVVEVHAGGHTGLGYTYADTGTARLIKDHLVPVVQGMDALGVRAGWEAMVRSVRNLGRPGVASMAISAVDAAWWDLKARLLGVPLVSLWGPVRDGVAVYGSGGFTSYSREALQAQLAGWAQQGLRRVKMKVGSHPDQDVERVRAAREAVGRDVGLFVDANGAYTRKQSLHMAEALASLGVQWFEEPVSSDDLEGLHLVRDRAPAGMDVAAGEYGYDAGSFRRMLQAQAVDVLQADATRCGGPTGFWQAAELARAFQVPLSAHCAPALHLHLGCAVSGLVHLEYFHDHARLEPMLFSGVVQPRDGALHPDLSRLGMGLELKRRDAQRYAVNS